ncbi:MAG: hypothetical protein MRZ52_06725, partial [Oscillospiraceae bacterium]|nr:hypothetical protein [Oscillospiraceae bacterium]
MEKRVLCTSQQRYRRQAEVRKYSLPQKRGMWYNKSYGAKLHYANEFCFAKLNKVISKAMEQSSITLTSFAL